MMTEASGYGSRQAGILLHMYVVCTNRHKYVLTIFEWYDLSFILLVNKHTQIWVSVVKKRLLAVAVYFGECMEGNNLKSLKSNNMVMRGDTGFEMGWLWVVTLNMRHLNFRWRLRRARRPSLPFGTALFHRFSKELRRARCAVSTAAHSPGPSLSLSFSYSSLVVITQRW